MEYIDSDAAPSDAPQSACGTRMRRQSFAAASAAEDLSPTPAVCQSLSLVPFSAVT